MSLTASDRLAATRLRPGCRPGREGHGRARSTTGLSGAPAAAAGHRGRAQRASAAPVGESGRLQSSVRRQLAVAPVAANAAESTAPDVLAPPYRSMSLVVFRSKAAGEIFMFAETARRIFEIIGRSDAPRGVITAEQVPDALQPPGDCRRAGKGRHQGGRRGGRTGRSARRQTGRRRRRRSRWASARFPLIEMLRAAAKRKRRRHLGRLAAGGPYRAAASHGGRRPDPSRVDRGPAQNRRSTTSTRRTQTLAHQPHRSRPPAVDRRCSPPPDGGRRRARLAGDVVRQRNAPALRILRSPFRRRRSRRSNASADLRSWQARNARELLRGGDAAVPPLRARGAGADRRGPAQPPRAAWPNWTCPRSGSQDRPSCSRHCGIRAASASSGEPRGAARGFAGFARRTGVVDGEFDAFEHSLTRTGVATNARAAAIARQADGLNDTARTGLIAFSAITLLLALTADRADPAHAARQQRAARPHVAPGAGRRRSPASPTAARSTRRCRSSSRARCAAASR